MHAPLVYAVSLLAAAQLPAGVHPADVASFDAGAGVAVLRCAAVEPLAGWAAVLARRDFSAIACGEFGGKIGGSASDYAFRFPGDRRPRGAVEPSAWRAWLVAPDAGAGDAARWPSGTTLHAPVIDVMPGARSVWLSLAPAVDVRPGHTWWIRQRGQPVARLEALQVLSADDLPPERGPSASAESDGPPLPATRPAQPARRERGERLFGGAPHAARLAFCRVTPLVADLPDLLGRRAALWPAARDRAAGVVRSAVVHVEPRGDGRLIWLAAPRGIACPPEPRVDMLRDGEFIAAAVVEARDDCFWYARTTAADGGIPEIRDGDEARIRSQRDIDERRFTARVFAARPDGGLINAGEIDGLAAGDAADVLRDGARIGTAVVTRAQRDYSYVRVAPEEPAGTSGRHRPPRAVALTLEDELDFSRAAQRPAWRSSPAGVFQSVGQLDLVSGHAFRATLRTGTNAAAGAATLLGRPLALLAGRRPVGVAVLLSLDGGAAVGVALPHSLASDVTAGWTLAVEAAPAGS